jgi:hypothetical protein
VEHLWCAADRRNIRKCWIVRCNMVPTDHQEVVGSAGSREVQGPGGNIRKCWTKWNIRKCRIIRFNSANGSSGSSGSAGLAKHCDSAEVGSSD